MICIKLKNAKLQMSIKYLHDLEMLKIFNIVKMLKLMLNVIVLMLFKMS